MAPRKTYGDASSSRVKNQRSESPFLPEDIFFHILLWLPAEFLHYYARYVCKAWSGIISDPVFKTEHFNRSKSGLFFQTIDMPHHGIYLGLGEGGFELGAVNGLFPVRIISSTKGISLFCKLNTPNFLHVGNLSTREFESLPYPLSQKERFLGCYITFVPQSSQYKVLYCVSFCRARKWRVWTLGEDQSWRTLVISSTIINLESKAVKISASAGGVIYFSRGRGAISAIDLNLETGYSVQVPDEFVDKLYWLREMGNNLSCGVNHKGEVHVYILKDLLTSEWFKVYKLGEVVDKRRFLFRTLKPVGWLRNGKKFVFIIREPGYWRDRYIVAYDVKTGETVIHKDNNPGEIRIHTNSLISPGEKNNIGYSTEQ